MTLMDPLNVKYLNIFVSIQITLPCNRELSEQELQSNSHSFSSGAEDPAAGELTKGFNNTKGWERRQLSPSHSSAYARQVGCALFYNSVDTTGRYIIHETCYSLFVLW